jgi:hypothetical protein
LAIGPINRSIEEEHRLQVLVRDNNVDQALRVLKKKMQREGVFHEMKLRSQKTLREESPGKGGSHPPRPQARPQKTAARGFAADEASGNPRGSWKRRPAARASLLILEQPKSTSSREISWPKNLLQPHHRR